MGYVLVVEGWKSVIVFSNFMISAIYVFSDWKRTEQQFFFLSSTSSKLFDVTLA